MSSTGHMITTYCTAGWSWHCLCGAEGGGTGAPTQTAAYAYGEKHIRHALRKARQEAKP